MWVMAGPLCLLNNDTLLIVHSERVLSREFVLWSPDLSINQHISHPEKPEAFSKSVLLPKQTHFFLWHR